MKSRTEEREERVGEEGYLMNYLPILVPKPLLGNIFTLQSCGFGAR